MSEVKVNKISPRTNCGTVTVGDAGDSVTVTAGVPVTVNGDLKSNALKAVDGGSIISQCGTNITLGASGDTINLAAGATQSGFGRTGTVDWDTTAKTATFSAVSGNGYFCNTTAGAFTVNLPAGSAGAIVSLADYAGTWQTNNLTVSPNGSEKIGSVNGDVTLNVEGQSVTFVYVDSTQGWLNTMDSTSNVRGTSFVAATGGTITTCGDCKIHTFTGPGTFCVSTIASSSTNNVVSYMVIAGGGAGGFYGGGGAGGFREVKSPVTPYTASPLDGYPSAPNRITVTATAYPITVGGGGAPAPAGGRGSVGALSSFSTITSAGGGQGDSGTGGSGGGASYTGSAGGAGNTPPVSPPQGQPGGGGPATTYSGKPGGGATTAGSTSPSGAGGTGATTSITGSSVIRAGGGSGGSYPPIGDNASPNAGNGGGGRGGRYLTRAGAAGTINTGSGGGGGGECVTGGGGSGIVVIRYKFQ
jgi:hypothetical protein